MKRVNQVLNNIIGAFVGVFIGRCAYSYWFYKNNQELYSMILKQWYDDILFHGLVIAAFIAVCVVIKLIVNKKNSN